MGGVGGGRIRRLGVGFPEAEVPLVALPAAIRFDVQKVQQKFAEASSSGPPDRRASTVWTTGGFNQERHGRHLPIWLGREVYIIDIRVRVEFLIYRIGVGHSRMFHGCTSLTF